MSDNDFVLVEGHERETAIHLIAANEELGYPATDVRSVSAGFYVHKDVKKAAARKPGTVTEEQPAGDAGYAPQAHINAQDWLESGQLEKVAGADDVNEADINSDEGKAIQQDNAAGVGSTGAAGESAPATGDLITDDGTAGQQEQKSDEELAAEKEAQDKADADAAAEQEQKDAEDAAAKEREEYLAKFPKGNASTQVWQDFAKTQDGFTDADLELSYADLKAKFGPVAE